jgi:hypothetical protein
MKNQQRWLTNKLKGTWMDKDALLEICLFESLVHYVEEEERGLRDNLDELFKEELEKGHVTQETVDLIKTREGLLKQCYDWIKVGRSEIVKILDTIEDRKEYEKIEKELYDEDSEVMRIIIEQRGYLWT